MLSSGLFLIWTSEISRFLLFLFLLDVNENKPLGHYFTVLYTVFPRLIRTLWGLVYLPWVLNTTNSNHHSHSTRRKAFPRLDGQGAAHPASKAYTPSSRCIRMTHRPLSTWSCPLTRQALLLCCQHFQIACMFMSPCTCPSLGLECPSPLVGQKSCYQTFKSGHSILTHLICGLRTQAPNWAPVTRHQKHGLTWLLEPSL